MINLYLHTASKPVTDFSDLLNKLPLIVQRHILRRKQKSKKEISLQGYLLLQKALQKDYRTELTQITFLDSGKPVIRKQNIHFNISHSGNLVGVAVSKTGTVGLDIEQFRSFEKVESSFSFFSKVEQEAILAAKLPERKLIEFWSKKEAFVKAAGGQMFEMSKDTDIRFSSTTWLGKSYFFHSVPASFNGYIWITSLLSTDKVRTIQMSAL